MIYAERIITKREAINRYGKLGYVPYLEYFKTNNEHFFDKQNYKKKVRFESVKRDKKFMHIEPNKIYSERA